MLPFILYNIINKPKPIALSDAALVKFIKEYITPIKSSKKIAAIIKLIFTAKINNSKEIKSIIACFFTRNKPNIPIVNKIVDNIK